VALSLAFQWRAVDFLALAAALRDRGFRGHLTAGGHFATFAALELLRDFPELDSLCRGEAEEVLADLACALRDGRSPAGLPGLAFRGERGEVALSPLRRAPEAENPRHSRAREHLEKVLKAAALATAALDGGACRCYPFVHDPMPPPFSKACPTAQDVAALGLLETRARWTSTDAGPLEVDVELTLDEAKAKATGKTALFEYAPLSPDGSIRVVARTHSRLAFILSPNPGVAKARVSLLIACDVPGLTRIVALSFDLSAPSPGAPGAIAP
jgi:hypothetical protein